MGPDAILSGLAVPADGRLTPELGVTAAEAIGFRARLTRRKLDDYPPETLPVVLFLEGRDACVLIEQRTGNSVIVRPDTGSDPTEIPNEELAEAYVGHGLVLKPTNPGSTAKTKEEFTVSGHWYWGLARKFWPDYVQVMLASLVVNLLALATPIFTMNVYDRVFPNAALITLWSLVAGVGLAMIFDSLLKWIRSAVVDSVGRRLDLAVSSEIFRHISDLKLQSISQTSGALVNALKDFEQVRDFFSSQTLVTVTDLCFSFLFIAVIAYLGGPMAFPPAIALGSVLILGLIILWPLRKATNASRQSGGIKNAVAVEAITELETLKAVAGHNRMQTRWEKQVSESAIAQDRSKKLATFATTFTGLAQQLSSVGIVVIGVYLALEGRITMGAVIAAMILSGRAMAPTAALAGLFVRGSFAVSTLRSLNALMQLPSDKSLDAARLNAPVERGDFSLKDVSLQYPGAKLPTLNQINLKIGSRERVGLIGQIGAGKTSLTRLLSGLYSTSKGLVLLDGLNIEQISKARLRRDVQLVPQDAVLFSGTLAENIAFGRVDAQSEDLLRAARLSGVDRIAAKHPLGLAMPITEKGRNLSGGQRQLIALARALLPRPRVLILDEPTSAMDTMNEKLFVARLNKIMDEWPMTLVVATHRHGLLDVVDRLILMDEGEILQDGPKADVLSKLKAVSRGGAR